MTRPRTCRSPFTVGVGYSFASTWAWSESNPSCWIWEQKTFRMKMLQHICLLDHLLRHTHPRPSRNNPVGTPVPPTISHVLIGLHSQTPMAYYPIKNTLMPSNIKKIRSKHSNQQNNTVMEMANGLACSTLCYVCCLIYFGLIQR